MYHLSAIDTENQSLQIESTLRPSNVIVKPFTINEMTDYSSEAASTFLKLPAEARNLIYKVLFTSNKIVVSSTWTPYTDHFQILFACRQFYNEAYQLFYTVSTFYLKDRHALDSWTILAPPTYLPLVKHVQLDKVPDLVYLNHDILPSLQTLTVSTAALYNPPWHRDQPLAFDELSDTDLFDWVNNTVLKVFKSNIRN